MSSNSSALVVFALLLAAGGVRLAMQKAPKSVVSAKKPSAPPAAPSTSSSTETQVVKQAPPSEATNAVLVPGDELPEGEIIVKGYNFAECERGEPVDYEALMQSYISVGYQGGHLGKAMLEVERMLKWRLSDEMLGPDEDDDGNRAQRKCKIFLGYTSNLISSGLRKLFATWPRTSSWMSLYPVLVGLKRTLSSVWHPRIRGSFFFRGADLRKKGLNRIGNLLVPNSNYCKFEDWLNPILDQMLVEQQTLGTKWTPSKMIHRLGKEINHPESVYYWCYKNNIPVYSPALTDGSIGDMIYFHSYSNPGLVLDIAADVRAMNDEAVKEKKTGMVILGGGVVKHHICNANLMRNGADFAVFVNTAQEFDGSDSGAAPDEAVSWGKIRGNSKPVKVHGDATIIFPLLVATTFAKYGRDSTF
ncbi:deoxyhypusine synthase [Batrachochytrium salamandrivorans]|nr:deoxyhypusine synthase [Batrachochytrium salamandrivorans]